MKIRPVAAELFHTDGPTKMKKLIDAFRLLWPCIMNVGWRERNQRDATTLMFIIKLLSQHVSGIIMPIIRRTRVCTAAYGVLHWLCGAGTRAVCTVKVTVRLASSAVLLMMGIMTPESCWDKSLIINIRLVASCWFLSLHPNRRFSQILRILPKRDNKSCQSLLQSTWINFWMKAAVTCHVTPCTAV